MFEFTQNRSIIPREGVENPEDWVVQVSDGTVVALIKFVFDREPDPLAFVDIKETVYNPAAVNFTCGFFDVAEVAST